MIERIAMVSIAMLLDLLFGDPYWLYHPVRAIGALITFVEKILRRLFHISDQREEDIWKKRFAGGCLVLIVLSVSVAVPMAILQAADRINRYVRFALMCFMCYQMLAMKSLRTESMKVFRALQENDIEKARRAVSMIVGRDTDRLTEEGVTRAAVETVAENTSDGVIAPLLFMMVFGVAGGFFYKAVNTMDSMLGYKNDTYCYFGTCAAKLDDVMNFIPARISAVAMILVSYLLGCFVKVIDGKHAVRIFKRDRYKHASPNSAQTEAVCAGALSIELAGDAFYFGKLYQKPTIGDALRKITSDDIRYANRLLYGTGFLVWGAGVLVMSMIQFL